MEQQVRRNAAHFQVARARPSDVGKPTVRLPAAAFDALGIGEGSIVEVTGKRSTAAIAQLAHPDDEEIDVVRLDGLQRTNAGVSLGEPVTVSLADVREARRVSLGPAQRNVRLTGAGEALRRALEDRPLTVGDVISATNYRRGEARDEDWYDRSRLHVSEDEPDYEELARTLRQERPGTVRPFGFALAETTVPGEADRRTSRAAPGRGKRRRRT